MKLLWNSLCRVRERLGARAVLGHRAAGVMRHAAPSPQPSAARGRGSALLVLALSACASAPPPPDWQAGAASAIDGAVSAFLNGDTRQHALQASLARSEIARTGRPALMARAELMLCAAATASLAFEPCARFDALRADAAPAELAYAQHLAAQPLPRDGIERLPEAQRIAAAAIAANQPPRAATIGAIDDPLSRLVAVAVLFQAGQASPDLIALATETASAQGWRRPLLAWLKVQQARAQQAGDMEEARRLARRVETVLWTPGPR
jgi:hypothetical protein